MRCTKYTANKNYLIEDKNLPQVTLSIVSHGQGSIVRNFLEDCRSIVGASFEILLTLNIREDLSCYNDFSDLPIRIIENKRPLGFGANHNAAFRISLGKVFIIVNPDIRAPGLDLSRLVSLIEMPGVGACAPRVLGANGAVEDSARYFPTFARLLARFMLRQRKLDYELSGCTPIAVDWVAGMFIAFRREAFAAIGGFDDRRFFMYMEDADICRRLNNAGWAVLLDPRVDVTHLAQRASKKRLDHMIWHTVSAIRFLTGL